MEFPVLRAVVALAVSSLFACSSGTEPQGDLLGPSDAQASPPPSDGSSHSSDGSSPSGQDAEVTDDAGTDSGLGLPIAPGDPGQADVTFDVDTRRSARPISRLIYGNNDASHLSEDGMAVTRLGGNRWTAFNWENNASNAGSDYLFQNDSLLSASDTPGKVVTDSVNLAKAAGAAVVVTVPIVDYVSADKLGGGDVRNSGPDYLTTRFWANHPAKGSPFVDPPNLTDKAVYQDEFAAWLKHSQPSAEISFSLDNEPDLWSGTHAEVHPTPVTYAELWDRNYRYAKALKAVWPEAKVLGVVSYGYNGFVNLQNATDANHGNFLEWYLDQAQAKAKSDGARVIDYLDLHWYPEATGGGQRVTVGDNSAAVAAAREQAPRSLWDATYEETSWIHDSNGGKPIDLVHWVQSKIDTHYPGTALAFSEWNFGGGDHISGAIAVADVLGIFGREGVALSTYWPLKNDESFARAGMRVYRNFDGKGATFADTSVSAISSGIVNTSVYASYDAAQPARVVVVAINKATSAKTAAIRISHSTRYHGADVYQLSASKAALTKVASLAEAAVNAFLYSMPAQSVSVLVPTE